MMLVIKEWRDEPTYTRISGAGFFILNSFSALPALVLQDTDDRQTTAVFVLCFILPCLILNDKNFILYL